jgi:hypothetical protein
MGSKTITESPFKGSPSKQAMPIAGVYREVESLVVNGLVEEDTGKGRILRLSGKMQNVIAIVA